MMVTPVKIQLGVSEILRQFDEVTAKLRLVRAQAKVLRDAAEEKDQKTHAG